MKLIDVHAHLTDVQYENEIEEILANAANNGVEKIVTAGFDLLSSEQSIQLAKTHKNVFAVVGIHPENVEEFDEKSFENLKKMAKSEKVVAIGEIGLDYHYFAGMSEEDILKTKIKQKEAFIKQIKLANQLEIPIVVHSRDAMGDTLEILKENPPKRPSLLHCYGGSLESAKLLMKQNFYFSFGGVVTFKNAKTVVEVVKELPLERIVLETDCPYLSPEPFRGKRNEPKNVVYVADKIAAIKGISMEEVANVTTANACKLFGI